MSKRTLLLADDSVTIQKVVNLTFADEGIEVVTVGDGDSAMEKISEISPDVVLADVHMPGLSGYQICEILRQNPVTRNMPVVLLVGSFEPFDESEAARVGANAYLTKPFQSIRQLVSQVTELMDQAVATDPPETFSEAEDRAQTEIAAENDFDAGDETREGEGPDTQDIESLYHKSFTEPSPLESDVEPEGAPRFVDAGMDDEMIETTFAGQTDAAAAISSPEFAVEGETGFRTVESRSDLAEPSDYAEEVQTDYLAPETTSEYGEADPMEVTQALMPQAEDQFQIAAASASVDGQADFDEFSNTDPTLETAQPSETGFGLDDRELLELPPIDNGKTLEFTTTQSMQAESIAKELVSLSPELMDMLVQKVVDKLSEK